MMMGRHTYEFFASAFPRRTGDYGKRINQIPKYVFSSTLQKTDWTNSQLVKGDVVQEVAKLKAQSGGDLTIYGHGQLGQTLLRHRLLDELKLWIHPCFVGTGKSLFREGEKATLKLIGQKTLGTGVIIASYEPVVRY